MGQFYESLNSTRHIAVMFGCGGCGAVVYDRPLHDLWHTKNDRATSALCPCGWHPVEGLIGGETLTEHQAFCPKAPLDNQ